MPRKIIVDRIEDNVVVCEKRNGKMINISLSLFDFMPHGGERAKRKKGRYIKIDNSKKEKSVKNLFENLIR